MKLKKEEEQLTDKRISFEEKIPTLVTVWRSLKELVQNSHSKSVDRIIEWAQRHTLNLVLHGDWASQSDVLKNNLYGVVEDFDTTLSTCGNLTTRRCKKLIEVIKDPWGDVTLCKILNEPDKCGKEEELNFFASENGYIVAMRLKKLCDSRCEDLALRFANACLRCLRLPESRDFHVVTTEDQKRYILDIYIALLHKYKRTHDIIHELKNLSLEEGLQLVHRFTRKRVELSRVWKHCASIAELAAKFFMTAAMMKPIEDSGTILSELLKAWIILNDKLEGIVLLPKIMRRIIQAADTSAHIYICCEVLNKEYGDNIKSFTIELYIRALTTDMNELEKQKQMSDNEKVEETTKRLSEGFLSLADLLQDNLCVSRECVLTSFSLNPTWPCMERIEKLALSCASVDKSQKQDANESVSKSLNTVENQDNYTSKDDPRSISSPVNKDHATDVPPLDTGQSSFSKAPKTQNSVFSNSELSRVLVPQTLGLSEQLCDDLAVVLSSPRYQYLSWVLDWPELKAACDGYLLNAQGSRNVVKELKYLNIDYNQFKDWPDEENRHQYGGIEKGYEQYTEDEENSNTESEYNSIYGQNYNDSDSSLITGRSPRRKKVRKIYSSDSDYDIVNRKIDSHSSDIDTASQDADSLGSDGLQPAFNKKSNLSTNDKMSRFTMIMNGRNQTETVSNHTKEKMMSIFAHMDKTEVKKPFNNSSLMQSFILPEKRSSDPKILKTLRMFRSNKKRNREEDNRPSKNLKKEGSLKTSDGKLIKFPLNPNMNPRVLLDRQDCNNFENKYLQKKNGVKQENAGMENKLHKYAPMLSEINMNPCVLLDRYEDLCNIYKKNKVLTKNEHNLNTNNEKKRRKLDVLADVPGLHSLEMIRPSVVQPTIQVVQLTSNIANSQQIRPAKSQSNSSSVTATTSNLVTSTPVTAHIQRVGQPHTPGKVRQDNETKLVSSNSSQSSNSNDARISIISSESTVIQPETINQVTTTKPSNSQSTPTLVNILSQQIIRPGQSSTPTNRNSTLINILSQQIIKPPIAQKIFNVATSMDSGAANVSEVCICDSQNTATTTTPSVASSIAQLHLQNSIKLVTTSTASPQPISLQQIFNAQGKNNNQVLKNVNLVTNSTNPVDATRLVQFFCKTDGKVVHLTPYSTNANIKLQAIDPNKLIKTTSCSVINKQVTAQPVSRSSISSPVRSGYEENYAKFIQTTGRTVPVKNVKGEFTSTTEELANSLPKFQQAFGKAGYQTTTSAIDSPLPTVEVITTSSATLTSTSVQTSDAAESNSSSKAITVTPQSPLSTTLVAKNVNTTTVTAKPIISSKSALSPLGVQTIQGSVIYTRQVPVSLSVSSEQINLIPTSTVAQATIGRNQVLRITSATGEQLNASKDNVIMRNKMSALLAAALQSNVPSSSSAVVTTITSTTTNTVAGTVSVSPAATSTYSQNSRKINTETEVCDVDSSSNDSTSVASAVSSKTSTLVTPMRITLPMMQRTPGPNGMQTTRIVRPILQIPQSMIRGTAGIRQQVLLAAAPVGMTSVVTCSPQAQTVPIEENIMAHSNIEPSVSSTTLEQLREFDLVLEQVKERSTTVQPSPVPSKIQVVKPPISVSTDMQEVISNVSVSYMNPNQFTQKVSSCTSVVVVTSYCNVQPAASPALSVTSQSSSSPCVTPAPSSSGSVGKTVPKTSAKSPKSKTVKTTAHASKTSPIPKPQQKPQEDEQTTQRIFDILAEYAEQLRNSPDLNNKPAPRRRSNPPTNPSQNSKRKKCSASKKAMSVGQCNSIASELSPGTEDPRTMGSEDSCGIVQLSVQNSPQDTTLTDDHQSPQCSSDFSSIRSQQTETSDNTVENQISQTGRQFIFTEASTNQSRNVIIADSAVSEALVGKLSNTAAVIVPANYIVPMVKGGQQIAVVSGNNKILATVPARSGSNMLLFQSFVNQSRKSISTQQNVKSVTYSTVQPIQGISSQILSGVNTQTSVVLSPSKETVTLSHPLSFKKITEKASVIGTDKTTLPNENLISNTNIVTTTGSSQKCNVILASGSVSDISNLNVTVEGCSSPANDSLDDTDAATKSTKKINQCIKIMPMCTDTISVENDGGLKIMEGSHTNSLLQNSFSLNFSTKESSTVPVFSQLMTRSPVIEKDKSSFKRDFLQRKMSEADMSSENKTQHNVIRTIIDSTVSDKIISTSNSSMKYAQLDCTSSVDQYSKMYIEDKKKSNTNGPMLGQSDSEVSRSAMRRESDKVVEKRKLTETMNEGTTYVYHKQKKAQSLARTEKDLQQRKQEALERELCLQKSLSEECEDLGVDEPSTSDLFPEADLLFDSNNSPSFDQLSHDIDKKYVVHNYQTENSCSNEEDFNKKQQEEVPKKNDDFHMGSHCHISTSVCKHSMKTDTSLHQQSSNASAEIDLRSSDTKNLVQNKNDGKGTTITLFSDDDNSDSTLRTDLLFESLDYPSTEADADYNQRDKSEQLANGSKDGLIVQSSTSNFSGSSYDEHTLMTTCASASDVLSPTQYDVNSSPLMHKYKYKYCNRKRLLSAQNPSKSPAKLSHEWENAHVTNVIEVIKMLSSDEDTSESVATERVKSSTSRSPSPTMSERKRNASPTWEENNDESNHSYRNMYNSNKVLKLSINNIGESVLCSTQESSLKHRKSVTSQCTLECLDSSTPPSPLSPEDGDLGSYGIGRGARRSTQRLKKKCPCCASPEKPKKMTNLKKVSKGQLNKKR